MQLVGHIIQKDFKRLKWIWLGWFLIVVGQAVTYLFASQSAETYNYLRDFRGVLSTLEYLAVAILIPFLLHGEAVPGTQSYWLTRPISRKNVLISKASFVVAFLIVPVILLNCFVLWQSQVGSEHISLAILEMTASQVARLAPLFILASLTRTFGQYIVAIFIAFVGMSIFAACVYVFQYNAEDLYEKIFKNQLLLNSNPFNISLKRSIDVIGFIIYGVAIVTVITHQFLTRRTLRTVCLAGIWLVVSLTASRFWSIDLFHLNSKANPELIIGRSVQIEIDHDKVHTWEGLEKREKHFMASAKLEVSGLSEKQFARLSRIDNVSVIYPDRHSFKEVEKIDPSDDKKLASGKYLVPLKRALPNSNIVNPYYPGREDDTWVWLLDTPQKNIENYRTEKGKYSSDATFDVYEWKVSGRMDLKQGAGDRVGQEQFYITGMTKQNHAVQILIAEKKMDLYFDWSPESRLNNLTSSDNIEFGEPIYILRNKKTGESFLPEKREFIAWTGYGASRGGMPLNLNIKELIYLDQNERQYGTLPILNEQWLADAEVVRMDAYFQGHFMKQLAIDDLKLKTQPTEYVEDNGIRKYTFITGEVQYEHVIKPDGVECKEYYKFGGVRKEWHRTKDSMDEGPAKEYYPTGEVLYEYSYKNNNIDGIVRKYAKDGTLISERLYKDAKDMGPTKK